ncbi:hypothetical protein HSBAA_12930 [Vreelandella sulfidaeris]|uniref:Cytochrome c domain-containing protein n=1 Tax=Vreelandella sulfidaeris TaxID=115553 RepID=A0A455U2V9_9GAMM|nr:hypothetical protein HSBAA_12930 [Halomonas sulfidaeris]
MPNYGLQLQTAAISGAQPEGKLVIDYRPREVRFADDHRVTLQEPIYSIAEPAYGELPDALQTSPRLAPPMIGLGLLEAIPEADLIAAADPDDADGDGISGRANQVWDMRSGTTVVGRFGWKAGEPSVEQQGLHAFAGDMGLTSSLVPHTDCMASQGCDDFPNGGTPEVSDDVADFVTFYASSLAVPMRRNMSDPGVKRGAERFNALGCASCHTPRQHTAEDAPARPWRGRKYGPIVTCCSTIWARRWLIIVASSRPMAANGALRRCGDWPGANGESPSGLSSRRSSPHPGRGDSLARW